MIRYELAGFIRSAQEVIADQAAEHHAMQQVYSRSRGTAYALLEAYYHQNNLEHDPFKVAEHQTVTGAIAVWIGLDTFGHLSEFRKSYFCRMARIAPS